MAEPRNKANSWTNETIAQRLEHIAELLEAQNANPYRVRAYRLAAGALRETTRPVTEILETEGIEGLRSLPTIGESLARSIEQLVESGKINLLERLQGETSPERILATVPGIGPVLAERIHEQLGITTLAELENAAYDGRLAQVPGFGRGRLLAVRESLAGRLRRRPQTSLRRQAPPPANQPPVSELLDIDQEYRAKARANKLPRISPRRFNPTREAWLPILHTERGSTHYTALYSNTARAHELGATHDWVVIYRDGQESDGQWTVVTGRYGPLKDKRVIRGRENECIAYYETQTPA
jgi:DNA polymerase (family 10)